MNTDNEKTTHLDSQSTSSALICVYLWFHSLLMQAGPLQGHSKAAPLLVEKREESAKLFP